MKKIYFIAALFAANTFNAQNSGLESVTLSGAESYWDGQDMSGTSNGSGLFEAIILDGDLEFSNEYDTTWGAASGYWSGGWSFSNQTSDVLTGLSGIYSSHAGGANEGSNYSIGKNGAEIVVANDGLTVFSNIDITNNNYAGSSMATGDSFAKQFGSVNDANGDPDGTNGEDWFLLRIVGYDLQGLATDSVDFYLADYRFSDNSLDTIVKDWTSVDLSSLGAVNKIVFNLSSSDVGDWGMNTPAFFALDNVSHSVVSFVGVEENEMAAINVYPNPVANYVNVVTGLNEGIIELYDLSGKQVMVENIQSTTSQLDVSTLAKGVYNLIVISETGKSAQKIVKQ